MPLVDKKCNVKQITHVTDISLLFVIVKANEKKDSEFSHMEKNYLNNFTVRTIIYKIKLILNDGWAFAVQREH